MKRNTKSALLLSIASIIVCCAMLMGTTMAWFTDSVTSARNQIIAGNLDVEVYRNSVADGNEIDSNTVLFDKDISGNEILWEPGAVVYETLIVKNVGNLALKYNFDLAELDYNSVTVDGEVYDLSDVIKVGVVNNANTSDRDTLVASVTEWKDLDDFELASDAELLAGKETDPTTIVLYWAPSDNDNIYNLNNGKIADDNSNELYIEFGLTLVATQLQYEEDSFDKTYDKEAVYPAVSSGVKADVTDELSLTAGDVTVVVPAGAPAGAYELTVTNVTKTTDANGNTTIKANIELTNNGAAVSSDYEYTVIINADIMSQNIIVHHGEELVSNPTYDVLTGKVSFKTRSFSPFSVDYNIFGTEVVLDGTTIKSGFFKGINPATLDASLLGDASEYIAVNYVKDGVKYYAVSERATTVIVDDGSESEYKFENGDYTSLVKTNQSGKLWSVISGLQNNDDSTVYILPGTYNEGTTIYVYSSMDIIGLGNAEDIKVVKTSSSSSNRHLFNANGTKSDYIEVTIRNLHLDATAKTTNNKDNAAVQSIRKSKVKCYDLIITKGTGWDAVAFYVNGNNAVDGVKYPAYLYVENCTLNTTNTFGIVTTSGSYKFYHNGLKYNSGTSDYTNNSGSIKNVVMEWNDWEW